MSGILQADDVTFGYHGSGLLFKNFNLGIEEGVTTGIAGANGSGKSTLMRLLSGFLKPHNGRILTAGKQLSEISSYERVSLISTLLQNVNPAFPFKVRQIVKMGRAARLSRFSPFSEKDHEAVEKAMDSVDVLHLSERLFCNLSGGEQQRVRLASCLAQQSKILFLDEPTSQLDIGHAINFMHLVQKLKQEQNITVIVISHDIQLMSTFLDRLVILRNGEVIADGPPAEIINSQLLNQAYQCESDILHDSLGRIAIFPKSPF